MSISIEQKQAKRTEKYEPFRKVLDLGENILSSPPEAWWLSSMLFFARTQRDVERHPDRYPDEIRHFVSEYGTRLFGILKDEANGGGRQTMQDLSLAHGKLTLPARSVHVMHTMSEALMEDENIENEKRNINHLSLEELCALSPRFRLVEKNKVGGEKQRSLSIFSETRQKWYEYPLPSTSKILHKGGMGRTILKIIAGANPNTIEAELPPNDFDYIVEKSPEGLKDAADLGADPDGIEAVHELDLQVLMNNRDLDMNNAFVGRDGIFYSDDALEAARTGKISIVSTKRGIYGSEIFYHEGIRILKNRGIMRLLKSVAEGKALSFDFLPVNQQVNMGIYWLVLAKRFSCKERFPEIMERLFELARQIGQVPEGATNMYDILDAAHTKYPFFDFDGPPLDDLGVARWLGRKFVKQIDKKYRDKYDIPSLQELERKDDDTTPYNVNLDHFVPDPKRTNLVRQEWDSFMIRSRRRTLDHLEETQDSAYDQREDD